MLHSLRIDCAALCDQAMAWMRGAAMEPLIQAEEALASKVKELGEEFIYLVFSGTSTQELKKHHTTKDSTTC